MSAIEDATHLARQKARVDAEHYAHLKLAEVNRLKLTPEYLELQKIQALSKNNLVYFGPSIPSYLGSLGFVNSSHPEPTGATESTTTTTTESSIPPAEDSATEETTQ